MLLFYDCYAHIIFAFCFYFHFDSCACVCVKSQTTHKEDLQIFNEQGTTVKHCENSKEPLQSRIYWIETSIDSSVRLFQSLGQCDNAKCHLFRFISFQFIFRSVRITKKVPTVRADAPLSQIYRICHPTTANGWTAILIRSIRTQCIDARSKLILLDTKHSASIHVTHCRLSFVRIIFFPLDLIKVIKFS